jgi:predicted TIM-barrel fold metal-dependent hydrolase
VKLDNVAEMTDTLVKQMDAFGVKKAVLTPMEPWISTEIYMQAAAIYPDRLMSACSLFPRPIDLAREKVRGYAESGCRALVLDGRSYHSSDPAALSLVEEAVDNQLALFLHHHEMTVDTFTFIDRISQIHEDGKFVVLHMGSLFGFHNMIPLMHRENIWLETSVTLIKLVESPLRVFLDALVQDVGVRRLVFGSDHFTDYTDLMAALNTMDLNVETLETIRETNAKHILNL